MSSPLQQADNPCSLSGGTKEEVLARFKEFFNSPQWNAQPETREQRMTRKYGELEQLRLTRVNHAASFLPHPYYEPVDRHSDVDFYRGDSTSNWCGD